MEILLQTTSIYGLILYLEKMGNFLFYGGTGNIINGLEKLMNEVGVEVIKGKEVSCINLNKNKIISVNLIDGSKLDADNIICNADPPGVYEKLIKSKKIIQYFLNGKK